MKCDTTGLAADMHAGFLAAEIQELYIKRIGAQQRTSCTCSQPQ